MPRPRKIRFVPPETAARYYKPRGIPLRELTETVLSLDGLEALRLADVEGLEQVAAAETMGISRSTFSRLLAQARTTVATALTTGQALRIEGGPITTAELRECGCDPRCRCQPKPAGDEPSHSGGGNSDE
jgi:predicted DNA-binding protein (UPF0251 family)